MQREICELQRITSVSPFPPGIPTTFQRCNAIVATPPSDLGSHRNLGWFFAGMPVILRSCYLSAKVKATVHLCVSKL